MIDGFAPSLSRQSRTASASTARGRSRNAAISWPLRTSSTSPTSTGWFQVLPSIAGNRASSVNLSGVADDERQLALFRQHQQQILIGQQHELAVAVASALPLALAVLEIDAREDAAVEAVGMPLVDDEVVEIRLQPARCPALLDGPSAGSCATAMRRMPIPPIASRW